MVEVAVIAELETRSGSVVQLASVLDDRAPSVRLLVGERPRRGPEQLGSAILSEDELEKLWVWIGQTLWGYVGSQDLMDGGVLARFRSRVEANQETGCWLWRGATSLKGYPVFSARLRGELRAKGGRSAARISYQHFVGSIPPRMVIRQKCQNKLCVNPDHLVPGPRAKPDQMISP